MEVLAVALALVLGFMLGLGVGALRAFRIAAVRRSQAGTSAALARIWPDTIPTRSASDILAGRIVVVLGGTAYELPVLPRRRSREWLADLDAQWAGLASALEASDVPGILALLSAETDRLYSALFSYAPTILPDPGDIDDYATDAEVLRAVLEVWAALHPLAVTLASAAADVTTTAGTPSVPPSSQPSPTAGLSPISMN